VRTCCVPPATEEPLHGCPSLTSSFLYLFILVKLLAVVSYELKTVNAEGISLSFSFSLTSAPIPPAKLRTNHLIRAKLLAKLLAKRSAIRANPPSQAPHQPPHPRQAPRQA
jgi:hypothetical protein